MGLLLLCSVQPPDTTSLSPSPPLLSGFACPFCLEGTKDVPKLAKGAGVLVGRAAGFLFMARSSAYKYAQEAKLVEV